MFHAFVAVLSVPITYLPMTQLSEYEEGEVPPPGAKRIQALEDQVERLSEENMRQSEKARSLSLQVCSPYCCTARVVLMVVLLF